jgi:fructokinase
VSVPGVAVAVADTVGAGDAFNGGLFAWLHRTGRLAKDRVRALGPAELEAALRFAALVAARTCERTGADPPWRHELPEDP